MPEGWRHLGCEDQALLRKILNRVSGEPISVADCHPGALLPHFSKHIIEPNCSILEGGRGD